MRLGACAVLWHLCITGRTLWVRPKTGKFS